MVGLRPKRPWPTLRLIAMDDRTNAVIGLEIQDFEQEAAESTEKSQFMISVPALRALPAEIDAV